jgi:hypothetical protein
MGVEKRVLRGRDQVVIGGRPEHVVTCAAVCPQKSCRSSIRAPAALAPIDAVTNNKRASASPTSALPFARARARRQGAEAA